MSIQMLTPCCGVRQGGLSSPILFNLYVDQLIDELSNCHVGLCPRDDFYAIMRKKSASLISPDSGEAPTESYWRLRRNLSPQYWGDLSE